MSEQVSETPLLLTPEEAARLLAIGRSKLYQLLERGEIPSIKIGRCRRIARAELQRWIDAQHWDDGEGHLVS